MLLIAQVHVPEEFRIIHALLAEMGAWDAAQAAVYGVPEVDTVAILYGDSPQQLITRFGQAGASCLIARWNGEVAGCATYDKASETCAELRKIYVRTEFRGKGIARFLLNSVLASMSADGYSEARLVTTRFMREALSLYRKAHFQECAAFERFQDEIMPITIFMHRKL